MLQIQGMTQYHLNHGENVAPQKKTGGAITRNIEEVSATKATNVHVTIPFDPNHSWLLISPGKTHAHK